MTEIIAAHGLELALAPALGGEVLWLNWRGQEILRTAPAGPHDVRDSAGFPLVPFSGRIENGRFQYAGRMVRLTPNMPPEPHAIHGHGWQSVWHVTSREPASLTLGFRYRHGNWPWAYRAAQKFSLTPNGLVVDMSVTNLSALPMPAGLGWHPYFPRGDAQLTCGVTGYWPSLGEIETPSGDADLNGGKTVRDIVLDNAFAGDGQPARLHWPDRKLTVILSPDPALTHWIIYIPEGQNYFCVEPVSHAPNAVNMADPPPRAAMNMLAPGATLKASCTLSVHSG
jgi:aldose 1-epimerase